MEYRSLRNAVSSSLSSSSSSACAYHWPNQTCRSWLQCAMVFFLLGMVISGLDAWWWWPLPKRCDSLQVLCTPPKLTFFSQVQNQKSWGVVVNNNGTDGNWGQCFFRFCELSVNDTISAIFTLREVCRMKSYNMLTVGSQGFHLGQVPGAYPIYCEGPSSCPLLSFLVLSATLSTYMTIRKLEFTR